MSRLDPKLLPNTPQSRNAEAIADKDYRVGMLERRPPGSSNGAVDLTPFVRKDTVTAKGDLIVATGSAAIDNLPVGTDDQMLYADSTQTMGVRWDDAPTGTGSGGQELAARAWKSGTQTAPASNSAVTFDTEDYDTDAIFTLAFPKRLTCKTAGLYMIVGEMYFAGPWGSLVTATIRKNGTDGSATGELAQAAAVSGFSGSLCVSTLVHLSVNDYVELTFVSASGGTLGRVSLAIAQLSAAGTAPAVGVQALQGNSSGFGTATGDLSVGAGYSLTNVTSLHTFNQDAFTLDQLADLIGTMITEWPTLGTYTLTNFTLDRTLDVASNTADELGNIVCQLITDLKTAGVENYTVTNPSLNRTLDANAYTLAGLAQILGTFINDRITAGDLS